MDLLNSKVYCMLANISWNRKAKKNNLTKEDTNNKELMDKLTEELMNEIIRLRDEKI